MPHIYSDRAAPIESATPETDALLDGSLQRVHAAQF